MSEENAISHWIEQVKAGDSAAANQRWHHYFDRLVRAVRGRLQGQNRAVSDEEDVVPGRFPDLADRDDLWHLLLQLAARKVVDKRRRDLRRKRGGGQQIRSLDAVGTDRDS
ncbi:ECF-type sigma factor [Planctomycetaceae bacterium SH139]